MKTVSSSFRKSRRMRCSSARSRSMSAKRRCIRSSANIKGSRKRSRHSIVSNQQIRGRNIWAADLEPIWPLPSYFVLVLRIFRVPFTQELVASFEVLHIFLERGQLVGIDLDPEPWAVGQA